MTLNTMTLRRISLKLNNHNDFQQNDTYHNDFQQNDTYHNDINQNDFQQTDNQQNDTFQNVTILCDTQYENMMKNEKISAASFCCQVAALVSDMFCNFYLVKIHKAANNSVTTEAREKMSRYLESLEI